MLQCRLQGLSTGAGCGIALLIPREDPSHEGPY